MSGPASGAELVEREQELKRLEALIDRAAAGDGRMALIEGPAGIGKTRLLAETRRLAAESGVPTVVGRAGELEREFPYGVVRQLFEGRLARPEDRESALAGPAAAAASVFESVPGEAAEEGAGFATLHGLYWLALNLAAEKPLLIAVDDIQWCDLPSLRFLAYLVRRLEGTPILVAATQRSAEPGTSPQLLAELAHDPLTESVSPHPLSTAAVREIVRGRLEGEPDTRFVDACAGATGGNPLLLRELLNALATEGVAPSAEGARAVGSMGRRAVSRSVVLRLSRLSAESFAVARAAAVLGDAGNLKEVSALTGLEEGEVAEAMRALVGAEILRPDSTLGFVHPLVLDAVLGEMSPAEREVEHGRAAQMLAGAGVAPERIATHLLVTSPRGDAEVVRILQEAGRSAVRKGAADSAASYLHRALAEGPSEEAAPQLEMEVGLAEALRAGPPAVDHLKNAYERLRDPASRAVCAHVLTRILVLTGSQVEAAALARRVMAELPPEMEDTRRAFEAFDWSTTAFGAYPHSRLAEYERYTALPVPEGAGSKMLAAISALGWMASGDPTSEECAELALASLEGGEVVAIDNGYLNMSPITALALADREEAIEQWDICFREARERGSLFAISGLNMWRGLTYLWRGDLASAEESLRTALDEFELWGFAGNAHSYCAGFLAEVMREKGDIEAAWAALDRGHDPGDYSDGARYFANARMALLVASGRNEEGIEAADEFAARFTQYRNPAMARWRMRKAEALVRLERRDEAIELMEDELAAARRWGAPGTVGPSLRVLGAIRGADGIGDLEAAVELLDGTTSQLELAKALAALGTATRLQRKPTDAREPLGRALELAAKCSAEGLAEHVRTELHATGARPRREALSGVTSLTPSERRVADLANEGMTNREIAQSLFVTPKTVEVHLSNTYRKLEIRSRRELPSALVAA